MLRSFFLVLAFVLPVSSFAQEQEIIRFLDDFRVTQETTHPTAGVITSYEKIQGTPYLFPDYREATIVRDDSSRYQGKLRYDVYTDEMEFQVHGNIYWITPRERITRIVLDGRTFLFLPVEGSRKGAFFELLTEGNCRLLAKYVVTFHEAEGAKPYQDPKPARFGPVRKTFFCSCSGSPAIPIRGKKNLLTRCFSSHTEEMAHFMRKEHLSLGREQDLIRLFRHYNSL